MSALAIERYSRNRKFTALCSGGGLSPFPLSPFLQLHIYLQWLPSDAQALPEKSWQAARTPSRTTHYMPHAAVHWVEICPVEGGLQCLGCYFGFLYFLEKGRILFWLRAKATALSILKQDFFKRKLTKKQCQTETTLACTCSLWLSVDSPNEQSCRSK